MALRLITLFFFLCPFLVRGQASLSVKVEDATTHEPLPGAGILLNGQGLSADSHGNVEFKGVPAGAATLKLSFVGYRDTTVSVNIPYEENLLIIRLSTAEEQLEEIIVSTTRTNSRIEDLPLKIEVLGLEDMNEESTLVPGSIASILGDLSIITIQRTNPINGNDAIRMQGLDPQYTLIARDGLPLFGGFSGSLGVLSIPPLDLKQVEIIKGSVSTLYGGGAIAGMINFISKTPGQKPQHTVLLNASTLKEKNLNTFFSGKLNKKIGYTLFAGVNLKSAVDVNHDGFSEIPEHQDIIVHPRFFFDLNEKTKFNVGLTSTLDNRKTGDINAVEHDPSALHPYLRKEKSFRNVVDAEYTHHYSVDHVVSFKTAVSSFQRVLSFPFREFANFHLNAIQYSSYSELSDRAQLGRHTLVTGVNLITESFRKVTSSDVQLKNYDFVTVGFFVQDDWMVTDKFTIEGGLRYDQHNVNGHFLLPRIALFYKATEKLSLRLASGAGYKTPNILSLTDPNPYVVNNGALVKSERSTGVNADINFNTVLSNDLELSLNQAFYFAEITNPLRVITDTLSQRAYLENQDFTGKTLGTDTYVRVTYKVFELYLGYNHTEAIQQYASVNNPMPFNPKDKFSFTVAYEPHGKWRTGVEASYFANQYYYNRQYYYNSQTIYNSIRVPNYWFFAAMIERKFPFGSVVINAENIFDARQSKHLPLVDGSPLKPSFQPVWGPLDGRVVNLSLKLTLD
jgi:outer membrane receptor for ferrienterochelin and colicins